MICHHEVQPLLGPTRRSSAEPVNRIDKNECRSCRLGAPKVARDRGTEGPQAETGTYSVALFCITADTAFDRSA